MTLVNGWLAGFFACAALQYGIQWWYSRKERVFLIFAIQCVAYTAFCLAMASYFGAKTIPDIQLKLDRFVTIGVLVHAVALQFYACLGERRDLAFRAAVTTLLLYLALQNQWAPLRGAVIALQTVQLPGGATSVVPIRTPPGASLMALYIAVLAVHGYGFLVARGIWRRARSSAPLVALASAAILSGSALAFLVDFAHVRVPYAGAWPHVIFVLCLALFLSREYAARGAHLTAHSEQLEALVATRTRELEDAKNEAERASRAKSQFLAHMSHEIRNPLHALLAYAQSLERDSALGEGQRAKLGIIRSSGQHLQTLISDVLEISKIEAGRPELVESVFDPRATLAEVARMFAVQASSKGIELRIECAPELPRALLGDGAKVKQILINLASNALKFTERGSVTLRASASARESAAIAAQIVVSDTGIGVAAQDAERMFRSFEQLEAGKRAGGTGLGLAISLAHARSMGGDLTVESAPGWGSAFTFTFVAKPAPAEAVLERQAPEQPEAQRRKALVVDDSAINRNILADLLVESGFETRTAADGEGAVSLHAEWRPDLVLIDLRMPGMGGLEAIRRMRATDSRAAIGALSASALEDDEREARASGANLFIRKPYDYQELLDEIARILAAQLTPPRRPASPDPSPPSSGSPPDP